MSGHDVVPSYYICCCGGKGYCTGCLYGRKEQTLINVEPPPLLPQRQLTQRLCKHNRKHNRKRCRRQLKQLLGDIVKLKSCLMLLIKYPSYLHTPTFQKELEEKLSKIGTT